MWIKEVVSELQQIKAHTQDQYGSLSEEALLWKPAPNSWSIAECLQHIIIANSMYLTDINNILAKAEVRTIEYPIKISWMGKLFLYFVDPKYTWKVSSPKIFKPIKENKVESGQVVVENYLQLQEDIIATAHKAVGYDHVNIITTSPLSSLLKFNIGEQFYIMMRHEKRHLKQADQVKLQLSSQKKIA